MFSASLAHRGSCAWTADILVGGPIERPLTDQFCEIGDALTGISGQVESPP
jgi:hypothetical protein